MTVRVGLLDTGVDSRLAAHVVVRRGFVAAPDGRVSERPGQGDPSGHGSALAAIIVRAAPQAEIASAEVFADPGPTSAALVARGLEWLITTGAVLINMSFGLRRDRRALREACLKAHAAGCVLVGAAPAQGPAVFPAAYPNVIAVTGDARCAPAQVTYLATDRVEFGACPGADSGHIAHTRGAGASFAAAHFSGLLAGLLAQGCEPEAALRRLALSAIHHGVERRSGGCGEQSA